MTQQDGSDRTKRESTPGGATGGGGIGARAVPPDSPGNDEGGIVGSGRAWHHSAGQADNDGATDFAGSKPDRSGAARPADLGDKTEEQDLNQPGDAGARIKQQDGVDAALAGDKPRPDYPDELVAPDDGDNR